MDAKAGKLLLLGVMLGCLGPALTVAACLSHRSPFAADTGSQDRTAKAQASLSASGEAGRPFNADLKQASDWRLASLTADLLMIVTKLCARTITCDVRCAQAAVHLRLGSSPIISSWWPPSMHGRTQ